MLHIDGERNYFWWSHRQVIKKKKKKIVGVYFINLLVDKNSFVKYTTLFFLNLVICIFNAFGYFVWLSSMYLKKIFKCK